VDHFLRWVRAEWDRAAGYALIVVGAVLLIVGYFGVRHSPYVAEELAFIISGGLGGLFLLGLGGIFLLSADLQDEWRKLDRIEEILLRHLPDERREAAHSGAAPAVERSDAPGDPGLVPTARNLLAAVPVRPPARVPRLVGLGGAGVVVALVVLVAAWQRASTSTDPAPAFRATALASAALVLLGAVAASAGLRVRRRLAGREVLLLGSLAMADATLAVRFDDAAPSGALAGQRVLLADGLHYYHRPGCAALTGLDARSVDLAALPPNAEPCGLCRTD
jgi:hypothetical protein